MKCESRIHPNIKKEINGLVGMKIGNGNFNRFQEGCSGVNLVNFSSSALFYGLFFTEVSKNHYKGCFLRAVKILRQFSEVNFKKTSSHKHRSGNELFPKYRVLLYPVSNLLEIW